MKLFQIRQGAWLAGEWLRNLRDQTPSNDNAPPRRFRLTIWHLPFIWVGLMLFGLAWLYIIGVVRYLLS